MNKKRGASLPIVMIAMVICHLVYIGLSRANTVKQERLAAYQDYYQASIQLLLADQVFADPEFAQIYNHALSNQVQENLGQLLDLQRNPLYAGGPQLGILSLEGTRPPSYLLYYAQLKASPDHTELCDQLADFACQFEGDQEGNLSDQPQQSYEDYQKTLQAQGWQISENYELNWQDTLEIDPPSQRLSFDKGWVDLDSGSYRSILRERDFELRADFNHQTFNYDMTLILEFYQKKP